MLKKKVLIAGYGQFGDLSDYYYWSKYLIAEDVDVYFLGRRYVDDRKHRYRYLDGLKDLSIKYSIFFFPLYTIKLFCLIGLNDYDAIFLCPTKGVEYLPKFFPSKNIIIDVRSESVATKASQREQENRAKKKLLNQFKRVSFITKVTMEKFAYTEDNSVIIPLGGDIISDSEKSFREIKLMYIGALDNRGIDIFLEGLSRFQKEGNTATFDIIGGGSNGTVSLVEKMIKDIGLKEVHYHGVLNHDQAKEYFDECNIGVCFVPKTEYYNNQPTTKLYEYTLSGMAVIATSTGAICEDFSSEIGLLIDDSAEGVYKGLVELKDRMVSFNSNDIRNYALKFHWRDVVKKNIIPLID